MITHPPPTTATTLFNLAMPTTVSPTSAVVMPKKTDNSAYQRITIRLPTNLCSKIKQLYPKTGVYQLLAETLITGFVNELERKNVREYYEDPREFIKTLNEYGQQREQGQSSVQRGPNLDRVAAKS